MRCPFHWELPLLCVFGKRFPHCLAKVFAPQDYAPIVLSGVVQSHQHEAVTTKLEVGFQFHLPYKTTTGEETSFLIATGPHVSVNTILGLPFMQGTGMILDLVDNLAECKYLDCPAFPIDYRRTSNHVPVTDETSATAQVAESAQIIAEITNLERYYEAKVPAGSSVGNNGKLAVHFGMKSPANAIIIDSDSVNSAVRPREGMAHHWVPPASVHEDDVDEFLSVLREDREL